MLPREYPGGLEIGVRGPATDSRDEMVAKRGHFARLRELRAHFHASAAPDENDAKPARHRVAYTGRERKIESRACERAYAAHDHAPSP